MSRTRKGTHQVAVWRLNLLRLVFITLVLGLSWRLADIQVFNPDFLRNQGDARHLRKVPVAAHRGMILDRHGEALAVSTPVHSVWLNPQEFDADKTQLANLAKMLGINSSTIKTKVAQNAHREFIYLKRRVTPELANKVDDLSITGVALQTLLPHG